LIAPSRPGLLYFNPNGSAWKQPFATTWFRAIETNIGAPAGARRVLAQGTDRTGQGYRIWARDYTGAFVVVRPVISWQARGTGDATAVDVTLPGAGYQLLRADGTRSSAGATVALRAGEAAILVK
jgi:hypothetical protein